MAQVEFRALEKTYPGGIPALRGVDLAVADGEFLVVVGPSGSGKSTLLRVLAGLEEPSGGSVWVAGERVDGWPPHRRGVGMVFQSPALYPHLSVFENLAFGLRADHLPESQIRERVAAAAAPLGLNPLLDRRPRALSGGQRQRAALGRAIAKQSRVLLLDEPLSNLDAPLRAGLRADLADLHHARRCTMILVTHDQAEALALGDRIAVLHEGRLHQVGSPQEVYHRPATRFVAEFMGTPPMNVVECEVARGDGRATIRLCGLASSQVTAPIDSDWLAPALARGGGRVLLGLRAEHVACGSDPAQAAAADALTLNSTVLRLEPMGHETLATLEAGPGVRLRVRLPGSPGVRVHDPLPVRLHLRHALWFEPSSGALLG